MQCKLALHILSQERGIPPFFFLSFFQSFITIQGKEKFSVNVLALNTVIKYHFLIIFLSYALSLCTHQPHIILFP